MWITPEIHTIELFLPLKGGSTQIKEKTTEEKGKQKQETKKEMPN